MFVNIFFVVDVDIDVEVEVEVGLLSERTTDV